MEATGFTAQVIILNHPGQITAGYTPVLDCHTAHTVYKFAELKEKTDSHSVKMLEYGPNFLKTGDTVLDDMVLGQSQCVRASADYPSLGDCAVCDTEQLVWVWV